MGPHNDRPDPPIQGEGISQLDESCIPAPKSPDIGSNFAPAASRGAVVARSRYLEYWFPLVVWLGLIYFFSTDSFSADETSHFIEPILRFLFPRISSEEIIFWHGILRKLGHVSEYSVLAVLAYRALKLDAADLLAAKVRSFEFVLLIALTDEFHQALTQYRGASMIDVGYDCLGGLLLFWLATVLRK